MKEDCSSFTLIIVNSNVTTLSKHESIITVHEYKWMLKPYSC